MFRLTKSERTHRASFAPTKPPVTLEYQSEPFARLSLSGKFLSSVSAAGSSSGWSIWIGGLKNMFKRPEYNERRAFQN